MGIPIRELVLRLSSSDITEYQAFYEMEPFGPYAENTSRAMTPLIIASALGGKGKQWKLDDFMPKVTAKRRNSTVKMKAPTTKEEAKKVQDKVFDIFAHGLGAAKHRKPKT